MNPNTSGIGPRNPWTSCLNTGTRDRAATRFSAPPTMERSARSVPICSRSFPTSRDGPSQHHGRQRPRPEQFSREVRLHLQPFAPGVGEISFRRQPAEPARGSGSTAIGRTAGHQREHVELGGAHPGPTCRHQLHLDHHSQLGAGKSFRISAIFPANWREQQHRSQRAGHQHRAVGRELFGQGKFRSSDGLLSGLFRSSAYTVGGRVQGYPIVTRPDASYDWQEHFTTIKGNHTIKIGGQYQDAFTKSRRDRARTALGVLLLRVLHLWNRR